ncbi:hypothetical protein DFH06DRAFT_1142875 [Mycena polygramma]|nr:hypothetical protein DFH06DRAFT_1142875 [Mycena polygramma]
MPAARADARASPGWSTSPIACACTYRSLAIIRDTFDCLKRSGGARRIQGWQNPLESLANLVLQAQQTGLTDFTPNPRLILREQTSENKWDDMCTIEADKEAKLQGLQKDKKCADLVKTNIVAKHFPRTLSETCL